MVARAASSPSHDEPAYRPHSPSSTELAVSQACVLSSHSIRGRLAAACSRGCGGHHRRKCLLFESPLSFKQPRRRDLRRGINGPSRPDRLSAPEKTRERAAFRTLADGFAVHSALLGENWFAILRSGSQRLEDAMPIRASATRDRNVLRRSGRGGRSARLPIGSPFATRLTFPSRMPPEGSNRSLRSPCPCGLI